VRTQEQDVEVRAILDQPVSNDGGFGYRLQAARSDTTRLDAEARWLGQDVALTGRVGAIDDSVTAQLQAAGSIVATDDSAFLARKLDGTFALVDAGEPGVRIYRENRLIAEADEDGRALLTGLVPFTRNRIAVAPGDYDMSLVLANTELEVVPGRGGTAVSLAPGKEVPVLLTITLPDGSFPAAGTPVRFGGLDTPWIVGYRGSLFVSDLTLPLEAALETKQGLCRFTLAQAPKPVPGEIPRVGPIACAFAP
jgi:outer membrane usher protein